jgi:hypothetical protein
MQIQQLLDHAIQCSLAELATLWRKHLTGPCPDHPIIRRYSFAWRVQAQINGGLSTQTRRRLRELDISFTRDQDFRPEGISPLKPGTEFVRQWNGATYRVQITTVGYVYDGQPYQSLSEIARLITGHRRSGPKFFGLK